MELRTVSIKIILPDEPGIYNLGMRSGTGKTYLYKSLKQLSSFNSNICAISYEDNSDNIIEKLSNNQHTIIMLDRYDLYVTEEIKDTLDAIRKTKVVLVSCKDPYNNLPYDYEASSIKFGKDFIEVK